MHIELRPFTEPEYQAFFQDYVPDPIMEPGPYKYDPEVIARSYHYNYSVRVNYAHFGIFLKDRPVGCFQLKRIDKEAKCCEFGIILQNEKWMNRGIGTEAVRKGMDIAKNLFGIVKISGDTSSRNKRMIRVFEKLGFQLSEVIKDAFWATGQPGDRLVFTKDFEAGACIE